MHINKINIFYFIIYHHSLTHSFASVTIIRASYENTNNTKILYVPVTVQREQSVNSEKTNKMQQSDVYYQLLSQHVSGIIMPIFRRTKTVLLHLVYCSGSAGCGW